MERSVIWGIGEVSEWLKEHDWKSCMFRKGHRGFESLSLHQPTRKATAGRGQLFKGLIIKIKKSLSKRA